MRSTIAEKSKIGTPRSPLVRSHTIRLGNEPGHCPRQVYREDNVGPERKKPTQGREYVGSWVPNAAAALAGPHGLESAATGEARARLKGQALSVAELVGVPRASSGSGWACYELRSGLNSGTEQDCVAYSLTKVGMTRRRGQKKTAGPDVQKSGNARATVIGGTICPQTEMRVLHLYADGSELSVTGANTTRWTLIVTHRPGRFGVEFLETEGGGILRGEGPTLADAVGAGKLKEAL